MKEAERLQLQETIKAAKAARAAKAVANAPAIAAARAAARSAYTDALAAFTADCMARVRRRGQ